MSYDEANAFMNQSGITSARFPEIGTVVKGEVTSVDLQQQRVFGTGEGALWDDGAPRMQLRIVLSTDERDADIVGDDGTRALYAKGSMLTAIRSAVKEAGAKGIAEGGTLSVKYHLDGSPPKTGFHAPKLYLAKYQPPAASSVSIDDF